MTPRSKLLSALALAASLTACQTTPPMNADLQGARNALAQARANPATTRLASAELDRAQQALQRAETAWADQRDADETRQLSYLAQRRAEIAVAVATQAQADERVQQAATERERVRLEARTREADNATQAARAAQANARTAQSQAEASRQDAEASRQAAEAARSTAMQQAQIAATQSELAAAQAERAAALERDLQTLQGRATSRGMVVTLGDVLFTTGSATLQPGASRSVQQLAAVLKQYPERRVLIEGFTDSQGSDAVNLELSQRRADAFRLALVSSGVDNDRLTVSAHGKADPVADNGTAAGRQLNRRVEVVFSDGQGRFASR
jgi:outer membrane protein OmpA-like peptidoglycan-associated protein